MEKNEKIAELKLGIETAFVNGMVNSNLAYKPQFVSNNPAQGKKVLSSIERELLQCDEFMISVAFITMTGLEPLKMILKELEQRGVPGRILTTDYLNFSEPKALKELNQLNNVEIRMYYSEDSGDGFHTKGYLFRTDDMYRIIVGSSNLTASALTKNKEWNTKIVSTEQGEYAEDIVREFEELWDSEYTLSYEQFAKRYATAYEISKEQRRIASQERTVSLEAYRLQPNSMQTDFINNLKALREMGATRALLVSATGTGKTYASAFALREAGPKRALFLVHREQIAKQAIQSYKRIFGKTRSFGLLSGASKQFEVDYLFSTMNMMAKDEVREKFRKDEFEFIIVDEAHRTGATSYQKIMEYFRPKFWLGMTASPERSDDFDVFKLFDHNIACEIRLQQALEENLLCPFHYFGITDIEIDGETVDDTRQFNLLTSDARVDYIIKQAKYYGYSGDRVKGLIFTSRKKEAKELSRKFNERGFQTIALTGSDSQEEREKAVERLVSDNYNERLDYIFTVDIFNEGVDIPEINQVIMLRPTESPIVFVQQLGRGLRKTNDKEFVVILDFIGNYKNNFMIPIALSGDRTYNKDNVRRYVMEGTRVIPGYSTIHFDEVSRKRIFAAIDTANFSALKLIKDNYTNLKYKLGRIPTLKEFDDYGEMDVLRIFENSSLGSYYMFLKKYEKDYKIRLNEHEENVIEFISKKLASGKRIHELEFLHRMLYYQDHLMSGLRQTLKDEYQLEIPRVCEENIINVMTNQFSAGSSKSTYSDCIFVQKSGEDYKCTPEFISMLSNRDFYNILSDLVKFGISRYKRDYADHYQDSNFVLYKKYTYEDICRLLNWAENAVPLNIGGYKYDKRTKSYPVFINYDKSEDIQDTIKYEDHFINERTLIAISKQSRTMNSEDVQNFLKCQERGINVELFVRKNKDDKISKEFYYLGRMKPTGRAEEFIMANTDKGAVEIEWRLDTPVREDIYEYIVNK